MTLFQNITILVFKCYGTDELCEILSGPEDQLSPPTPLVNRRDYVSISNKNLFLRVQDKVSAKTKLHSVISGELSYQIVSQNYSLFKV